MDVGPLGLKVPHGMCERLQGTVGHLNRAPPKVRPNRGVDVSTVASHLDSMMGHLFNLRVVNLDYSWCGCCCCLGRCLINKHWQR